MQTATSVSNSMLTFVNTFSRSVKSPNTFCGRRVPKSAGPPFRCGSAKAGARLNFLHDLRISCESNVQTADRDDTVLTAGNGLVDDAEEFSDPCDLVSGARMVSVRLPLGAYLEVSAKGEVFVDELIAGGNGQSACIGEGDIIVAVSLPFGDALVPVPRENGLNMIQDYMESRDQSEPYFNMALISTPGLAALRQELTDKESSKLPLEKMKENTGKIFVPEYPSVPIRELDDAEKFDPDALRAAGFDI